MEYKYIGTPEITIGADWKFYPPENNKFVSIFMKLLKGEATEKEKEFAVGYAKEYQEALKSSSHE